MITDHEAIEAADLLKAYCEEKLFCDWCAFGAQHMCPFNTETLNEIHHKELNRVQTCTK